MTNNGALIATPVVTSTDWDKLSLSQIKAGIARTRNHMDERLADLGRKFAPRGALKRARIPLSFLGAAVAAYAIYRIAGAAGVKVPRWPPRPKGRIREFKLRSAGKLQYLRALTLLAATIRKGGTGVFIVEPAKD
ncbi:MAG: hypothetical protein ABIW76_18250 [Fibrobacteria bacterium]